MADEKEKVLYEFRGDVSSLKKSTQDALGLLDKFQTTMDKLNSEGIVNASKRAQAGFQNSVNKMSKSITSIQKKLNSVGDVRMPRGTEAFNATKTATDTLSSTLDKLNSSNTITSKSLNELKANLNTVTTGLKNAGPSFDSMVAKEEKFQQRLAKIEATANKFSSKLYGATDKVKQGFNNLGTSIGAKFSSIGAKFDPLVSKIQGFKDKAVIAGNRVSQVFSTVAAAFRRTSDGTEGASRSQSKLGRVLDSIKEKLNSHKTKLEETSSEYADIESASGKAFSKMSIGISALTTSLSTIKNMVGGITDTLFTLAGVDMGNLFADGAKGAIDYVENLNLFQVAMGSSIDKGRAFVNQMQEVYGMDPSNLYRYAGYFYQLTDAIGMCEEASASVSLSMTKAANDIASLFNEDIETVVDNLASGMQGMSRAVRKYGMDIRTTTLEQTALKYGIEGEVESMSEANRQALRYITMLEQAQNALNQTTSAVDGTSSEMGDFARNIETPANQLRIFKEQMSQLGRAIGNFIVAPLQRALPYINGFIMALRTLVNFLATIAGIAVKSGESLSSAGESAEDAADGVSAIGGAAADASKKLKQLIAPFDELNVLQESSGEGSEDTFDMGSLDPALAKALQDMELNLDNIAMKANKVRDSILEFLGLKVTTDPITQEQIIQWDKEAFMSNVMGSLNSFKTWFTNLSPLTKSIATIAGVVAGILATGDVAAKVSALLPTLANALNTVKNVFTLLTNPVLLVIAALTSLLVYSESFRTSFVNLFAQVGSSLLDWGGILAGIFITVGTDITNMWSTHIQPTITAIGDALAPALDTLGSLWGNLSTIVSDVFMKIGNLWTTVLKPVIEGALTIIQSLADKFKILWEQYVGPVIEYIGNGLQELWTTTFSPVLDKVISLLGEFWTMIMALWNNVLSPLIDWLISFLGPMFKSVFIGIWNVVQPILAYFGEGLGNLIEALRGVIKFLTGVFTGDWNKAWEGIKQAFKGIWDNVVNYMNAILGPTFMNIFKGMWNNAKPMIDNIIGAAKGLIGVFKGIIQFLTGVFKGDWKKAWEGIKKVFKSIWDTFTNIVKVPINNIIGLINGLINSVETGLNWIVDGINKISLKVPDWVPNIGGKEFGFNLKKVSWGNIPYLAQGGVVTGPTPAMIGEGKYSEAVIPLDDSPQMNDLINKIVEAIDKDDPSPQPVEVRVYIGDKEYDAYTYKASERGKKIVGKQPVKIGG